jgi:hypothetical protein
MEKLIGARDGDLQWTTFQKGCAFTAMPSISQAFSLVIPLAADSLRIG